MDRDSLLVCRIEKGGHSTGSGVIVEINPELLTKLSCLSRKYPEAGNVFKSPSYVLLTAHSNVYDEADDKAKDGPVAKYIDKLSVVLGNSVKVPLSKCVLFVEQDKNRRGLAVSCCGVDSILLCGVHDVELDYTLRAHGDKDCCIESNFLILFLNAEELKHHIAIDSVCTPLKIRSGRIAAGHHNGCLLRWCDEEGALKEQTVDIHIKETNCSGTHRTDPRPEHSLAQCIEDFCAQRSIDLVSGETINPCCIGAPIFTTDGSSIIGIYAGGKVTTVYGIFALLEGGLVPFLAAMKPDHSSARTLMPSRWEAHVKPYLSGLNTLSSVLDLLHHLLYHEEDGSVVRILKFSLEGGSCEKEILSSLKIYKVIFSRYGEIVRPGESVRFEHNESRACKCFGKIKEDMKALSAHFASVIRIPKSNLEIVKALFECFEAMQKFNFEDMAREILQENRKYLDDISRKENIDPIPDINKCFKMIDILNRERPTTPDREKSGPVVQQATNDD